MLTVSVWLLSQAGGAAFRPTDGQQLWRAVRDWSGGGRKNGDIAEWDTGLVTDMLVLHHTKLERVKL